MRKHLRYPPYGSGAESCSEQHPPAAHQVLGAAHEPEQGGGRLASPQLSRTRHDALDDGCLRDVADVNCALESSIDGGRMSQKVYRGLKIETSPRISRAVVLDVIGGSFERVLGRVGVGLRQRLLSSGQGHRVLHRAPHVVALAVKARRV